MHIAIASIFLLVSPAFAQALRGGAVMRGNAMAFSRPTPNLFVDSVNGSDSNDGLSLATAWQTVAKLLTHGLASNDTVCLARGSEWREQLNVNPVLTHVSVVDCGSGAKPILNASDLISAGSWTLASGKTQTYQATVVTGPSTTSDWVNAWEDGNFLQRGASVADCDTNVAYATYGCYFPSSDTAGTITLSVRSGDGSNPATNGKVYEYSHREFGLDTIVGQFGATTATYFQAFNIVTKNNYGNDGSMRLNRNALCYGCEFWNGGKHNVYVRAYSRLVNCLAKYYYFGTSQNLMYVWNENIGTGVENFWFQNCTADATNGLASTRGSGFDGHTNTSGGFGTIYFLNVKVLGVLASGINAANIYMDGGSIASTVNDSINSYGGTIRNAVLPSRLVMQSSASLTTITGCTLAYVYVSPGADLTISGSSISTRIDAGPGTVISTGNTFTGSIAYALVSGAILTSNNNDFFNGASATPGSLVFVTKTRAQWLALGYDANSTFH